PRRSRPRGSAETSLPGREEIVGTPYRGEPFVPGSGGAHSDEWRARVDAGHSGRVACEAVDVVLLEGPFLSPLDRADEPDVSCRATAGSHEVALRCVRARPPSADGAHSRPSLLGEQSFERFAHHGLDGTASPGRKGGAEAFAREVRASAFDVR